MQHPHQADSAGVPLVFNREQPMISFQLKRGRRGESLTMTSSLPCALQWSTRALADVWGDFSGVAAIPAATGFKSIEAQVASKLASSRMATDLKRPSKKAPVHWSSLEVFLDVMLPVLGGHFLEEVWTENPIKGDDFSKLRQAGPFDEIIPNLAASWVETLNGGVNGGHHRTYPPYSF
jgi:hypothetical protein